VYGQWGKNPSFTSSNTSFILNNERNVNKCQFLLSFTQLSIWSNKFLGKGLAPIIFSNVRNSRMQCNFPCKRWTKNESYGGSSNNSFDSTIGATSKAQKSRNIDPIVKLGSFGHNSFEYWAYISSPCPWATCESNRQLSKPRYHFVTHCSLGTSIFTWSILSWITHGNSSFDWTNFILHVWHKFLHDSWCKMCFLSFISYSNTLLLWFTNLDIKYLRYSQIIHFAKIDPHFCTSMLRWCFFLNLIITDWEIPPMFNSLLILTTQKKS
jgi:hypothetical protein